MGIVIVAKSYRIWQFYLFYMHFPQKLFKYESVCFNHKENIICNNMGPTAHFYLNLFRSYSSEKVIKIMAVVQFWKHVALALDS